MPEKGLKDQVRAEVRKRRYFTSTILLLSFLYLAVTILFGDTGVVRYADLRRKSESIEVEIRVLEKENMRIEESLALYKGNEFYVEKHAREDFGLARPDEYIFIYE